MIGMTADTLAAIRQDRRRQAIDDLFEQPWVLLYRHDGAEPLVLVRHGDQTTLEIEVAQELRLFLDDKGQRYRITESGGREIVVRIGATEISIRQGSAIAMLEGLRDHAAASALAIKPCSSLEH